MPKTWLLDSRSIARKVKNATQFSRLPRSGGAEAKRHCPNCNYVIDNSDVSYEWPGLPAGVKFDPSDVELLKHLAAKVGCGDSKPHVFIDEFIPTLEESDGICYTHPENLSGIKRDGSSVHFFHRTANAYNTGTRKRGKIQMQCSSSGEHVRWHKTGKTKPIFDNGVQKGFKKIMVLYSNSTNSSRPDKANWVMHQYHLGSDEEENDGEYVISKVSYQQHQKLPENKTTERLGEKIEIMAMGISPKHRGQLHLLDPQSITQLTDLEKGCYTIHCWIRSCVGKDCSRGECAYTCNQPCIS